MRTMMLKMRLMLVMLAMMMVMKVEGFCPPGCQCDDHRVSCINTSMEVMPISLNPSITSLTLQLNTFTAVDASISFYTRLHFLDLSSNRIHSLQEKIFSSQQNLRSLQLASNNISSISAASFSGLNKLQVLNMSSNPLVSIPSKVFSSLPSLSVLILSDIGLREIGKNSFVGLSNLKYLNLANNQIQHVSGLDALVSLEKLDISNNHLTSILPFSFQHNANLKTFIMSDSPNLRRIHRDAFSPNLKLENVTVSGNFQLEEIEDNAFNRNVSALLSLDLSNNKLSSLAANLTDWSGLVSLQVAGNPWHCDCQVLFIRRLIEDLVLSGGAPVRKATCSTPLQYQSTDILSINRSVCSQTNTASHKHSTGHRMSLLYNLSSLVFTTLVIILVILIITAFTVASIRRFCREKQALSQLASSGNSESLYKVRPKSPPTKIYKISDHTLPYQPKPSANSFYFQQDIPSDNSEGQTYDWQHLHSDILNKTLHSDLRSKYQPQHDMFRSNSELSSSICDQAIYFNGANSNQEVYSIYRIIES